MHRCLGRASIKRLVLLAGLLIAGCLPAVQPAGDLSFTTIERKDDAAFIGQQQYNALDAGLLVVLDEAGRDAAGDLFTEDARRQIDRVDLDTHFLVAVFQGWQSNGGYGATIESIRMEGDVVRVAVVFRVPQDAGLQGVTSPYHLVAVRRPYGELAAKTFELIAGDRVLAVFPTPAAP